MAKDLLFEIGCEELPAAHVGALAAALAKGVQEKLESASLSFSKVNTYFTPRRLAVLVEDLAEEQTPQHVKRRGPSVESAYDQHGNPTLACIGFARSCGCSADELRQEKTEKGTFLFYEGKGKGEKTTKLLPELLEKAVSSLPMPKPMRWGSGEHSFLRPVRWIVLRYADELIEMNFFGHATQPNSFGHRFHCPGPVVISDVRQYAATLLRDGMVVAEPTMRKQAIKDALQAGAKGLGTPVIDEALLDEVAALVEWPVILRGHFDQRFLSVPAEVLITSMRTHQKCFPIRSEDGKLAPAFLLVSNIESKDPKQVIRGNERVIGARLSDAAFFYQKDNETTLADRRSALDNVVFEQKLGSVGEKTERLKKVSSFIAGKLDLDKKLVKRAAELCKCDLVTGMVGEFPSLQGVMGSYYAANGEEPKEVVQAIADHYLPRSAADNLPEDLYSAALALADRLDVLVGVIGINKKPKGDKDPFGLRRASLGIVRIVVGLNLELNTKDLLKNAISAYGDALENKDTLTEAMSFIDDRLRAWYLDQGISPQVFASVESVASETLQDFSQRIHAVVAFQSLPQAEALAAANKRVSNILKKNNVKKQMTVNNALLKVDAEKNLVKALQESKSLVEKSMDQKNYVQALSDLAALREPIDHFFDEVMIMDENTKTRENRLAILLQIRELLTAVADISEL